MKKHGLKLIIGAALVVVLLFGCGLNSVNETNEEKNTNSEVNEQEEVVVVHDMNTDEEMNSAEESADENTMNHQGGNMDVDITEEEEEIMMTNEGELAPDFEFVDSSGTIYNNETFLGEKVYIKYWASWCSICLAGLDEIDTLFLEAEGFTVYTVVTPGFSGELSQEDFEEWIAGLDQKNIKVLFDMDGESAMEFSVRAFPTSIYIGSDGVLISTSPGHQSNEKIIEKIDSFY